VNFYRRFLPNCAQVLRPLTDLLKGGPRILQWTTAAQESFQKVKRLLAAAVPLQHPSPTAELSLATDASDTHIGGVMQQKSGNHWRPLGFFSRKFTDTESRYSTSTVSTLCLIRDWNKNPLFRNSFLPYQIKTSMSYVGCRRHNFFCQYLPMAILYVSCNVVFFISGMLHKITFYKRDIM
jgi:hypothetical protein